MRFQSRDIFLPIPQSSDPIFQSLDILHNLVWRRRIGIPPTRRVMSIDNIAAFLKCRMERVAIGFSKNARLLKMLRIEVIPMPLDHPEKGDILQSALPRSPQAVVYAGGFPIVLVLLIVVVELLRRARILLQIVDAFFHPLRFPGHPFGDDTGARLSPADRKQANGAILLVPEVVEVVHKNQIVREYDNLPLSCFFDKARGYLSVVERRYRIVEN